MSCEHKFIMGKARYNDSHEPLPGTGARSRTYYQEYFCEKCLEKKHEHLPQMAHMGSYGETTYDKVKYDAMPISQRDIKR